MELKDQLQPASPQARILVVEDEVLTRMGLAEDLRDAGYFVVEASNADDAMAYLKTGSRIDLVVSDVQMPGSMDGLELARRLDVEYPSLPVILSSGGGRPRAAVTFITKPYAIAQLLSTIAKVLRQE